VIGSNSRYADMLLLLLMKMMKMKMMLYAGAAYQWQ
jgi:hypothetical protein